MKRWPRRVILFFLSWLAWTAVVFAGAPRQRRLPWASSPSRKRLPWRKETPALVTQKRLALLHLRRHRLLGLVVGGALGGVVEWWVRAGHLGRFADAALCALDPTRPPGWRGPTPTSRRLRVDGRSCDAAWPGAAATANARARRHLERLAADPAILALMRRHRLATGVLAEMASDEIRPTGRFYVAGLNRVVISTSPSHNQLTRRSERIELLLRDARSRFRAWGEIIRVMVHELAHCVHDGDHGHPDSAAECTFRDYEALLLGEYRDLDRETDRNPPLMTTAATTTTTRPPKVPGPADQRRRMMLRTIPPRLLAPVLAALIVPGVIRRSSARPLTQHVRRRIDISRF